MFVKSNLFKNITAIYKYSDINTPSNIFLISALKLIFIKYKKYFLKPLVIKSMSCASTNMEELKRSVSLLKYQTI